MNTLINTIQEWQDVLGICPCCGELFRLSEAKLVLPHEKPRPSDYADLLSIENIVQRESSAIDEEEFLFQESLKKIREEHREAGRYSAREKMKTIDPHFSGLGVDPGVVKVLFHPIEHIVFHCLDEQSDNAIEFVSRAPQTKLAEVITRSIERVIASGNVEYELLRIDDEGEFSVTTEFPRRRITRKATTTG